MQDGHRQAWPPSTPAAHGPWRELLHTGTSGNAADELQKKKASKAGFVEVLTDRVKHLEGVGAAHKVEKAFL